MIAKAKTIDQKLFTVSVLKVAFQQLKFTQIPFISVSVIINDYLSIVVPTEIQFIYRAFHVLTPSYFYEYWNVNKDKGEKKLLASVLLIRLRPTLYLSF